jgi:hypothetical protein
MLVFLVSTSRVSTQLAASERSQALPFLPKPTNLEGYVGNVGFDPLGISNYVPMDYLREAELKHGRICMLAWLGFVAVDQGVRVYPVPEGWGSLTSVTAHDATVASGALGQILLFVGILEMLSYIGVSQMLQGSGREPGYFGFDPLNLYPKTEEKQKAMQLKEVKNGRLAMLAFGGVVTQSVITGSGFPYMN